MAPVDMSPEAIARRLRQVDQLRALCIALAGPRLKRPWGVPATSPDVPKMVKEKKGDYKTKP